MNKDTILAVLTFVFVGHGPWVFIGLFLFALILSTVIKDFLKFFGIVIRGQQKIINNNYSIPAEKINNDIKENKDDIETGVSIDLPEAKIRKGK